MKISLFPTPLQYQRGDKELGVTDIKHVEFGNVNKIHNNNQRGTQDVRVGTTRYRRIRYKQPKPKIRDCETKNTCYLMGAPRLSIDYDIPPTELSTIFTKQQRKKSFPYYYQFDFIFSSTNWYLHHLLSSYITFYSRPHLGIHRMFFYCDLFDY